MFDEVFKPGRTSHIEEPQKEGLHTLDRINTLEITLK